MERFKSLFHELLHHFGPQHWWPADSNFEMMVGAILTQSVNWKNVERAISNLKREGLLFPERILDSDVEILWVCLRPTRFYKQKARRLRNLSREVVKAGGTDEFLKNPGLRSFLLRMDGIGPETADCIALYAAGKPYFVIDGYTKRILKRRYDMEGIYSDLQTLFHDNLAADVELYGEYHALLVALAVNYCNVKPRCDECPVGMGCEYARQR